MTGCVTLPTVPAGKQGWTDGSAGGTQMMCACARRLLPSQNAPNVRIESRQGDRIKKREIKNCIKSGITRIKNQGITR